MKICHLASTQQVRWSARYHCWIDEANTTHLKTIRLITQAVFQAVPQVASSAVPRKIMVLQITARAISMQLVNAPITPFPSPSTKTYLRKVASTWSGIGFRKSHMHNWFQRCHCSRNFVRNIVNKGLKNSLMNFSARDMCFLKHINSYKRNLLSKSIHIKISFKISMRAHLDHKMIFPT